MLVFAGPLLCLFGSGFGEGATIVRILAVGARQRRDRSGRERARDDGPPEGDDERRRNRRVHRPRSERGAHSDLGCHGAAVATATGVACANLVLVRLAWRSVGIYAPALRLPAFAR
jgi:hypothetical protein